MISNEQLAILCKLTLDLTRLRQNECKHLCIENFADEMLSNLIRVLYPINQEESIND